MALPKRPFGHLRIYLVVQTNEGGTAIWSAFSHHSQARAFIRAHAHHEGAWEVIARDVKL